MRGDALLFADVLDGDYKISSRDAIVKEAVEERRFQHSNDDLENSFADPIEPDHFEERVRYLKFAAGPCIFCSDSRVKFDVESNRKHINEKLAPRPRWRSLIGDFLSRDLRERE